jgi:hypothetical protein
MWKKKEKVRKGKNNNKVIIGGLSKLLGSFLVIFVLLSVRCTQEQKPEENNLSGMIYGEKVVLGVKEKRLETAKVGCSGGGGGGGSGGGSSNSSPGGNNSEQPGKGYVLLKVSNANSNSGVENAVVYVNGVQVATTSQEGTAFFPLNPDNYIIKVSAQGFADSFFSVSVQSGSVSVLNFSLTPYRFSFEFNTSQGAQAYDRASGVKIVIPAGGLQKESGGTYNGKVYLKLSYIDPKDPLQLKGFPGDFVAQKSNGEKVLLETFGPIEVKLLSESGEKLNLPSGVVAEVSFPIPANMVDYVPDIVPLWSFDESKAEWVEEGVLYKVLDDEDGRYVLKGYVSHFSWWNPDVPQNTTCVKGRIKDERGNPLVGVPVWSEGIDYNGGDLTGRTQRRTDSEGKFFTFVKKNAKSKIKTSLADGVEIELAEIQTTSSYPSYYLKDWMQNPQGAWSICPDIGEFSFDKLTIILRWGNKKCDLDLHITGPKSGGGRFHIATKLWGRKYLLSEILGDDYPEVASLSLGTHGVYRVSVYHNNPNDTDCGRLLKDSGAVIQVWKGNRVVATASPPSTGSGNIWKALDIQVGSGGVTINEIREIASGDYCTPYHPDPSYEQPCPTNSAPTFSADVPAQVEGGSVVIIPLNVSDPDGDSVEVEILSSGNFGRFYTGDGYIVWETPDVRVNTNINFTIKVDDLKGGIVSASYSVVVKPPSFYKVWEFIKIDGEGLFVDIALTNDGFYTILIPQRGPNIPDIVVKFDQNGRILNTKVFDSVWDISVGSDGVYVAEIRGAGIFALSKHSLDLSSTLWELTTTINGRDFMAVDVSGNDVYVAFAEGGNYFIKKYSSSGVLLWTISFPRGGDFSLCWGNCLVVNKDTGDIYFSIYEEYPGQDYQKVFRISPSGSVLSSITFVGWEYVHIYPSGTSVYLARNWSFLEVYDQNFNLIRSLDICSAYPSLCSSQYYYWITNIFVSGGKLYALGGKSIFDSNLDWLRDSLALFEFTLGLDLVYVKDVGISYRNDFDYGWGLGVLGNSVYIVGEFLINLNYYPFALKYTR